LTKGGHVNRKGEKKQKVPPVPGATRWGGGKAHRKVGKKVRIENFWMNRTAKLNRQTGKGLLSEKKCTCWEKVEVEDRVGKKDHVRGIGFWRPE